MIEIKVEQVKNKEEQAVIFEKAVKRFKKACADDGFLKEIQDRRYYKKPSEKRREYLRRRANMYEKIKKGYTQ